jgi:hypothetical protein
MRMFKGPEAPVSALAWTPDGRRWGIGKVGAVAFGPHGLTAVSAGS